MIASKQRTPSFSGTLCFIVGLFSLVSLSSISFGQDLATDESKLELDDFAEIYVDRYFEPESSLKLTDESRNKAEALAHYSIGRTLENDGQPDAAISSYERVLKLQPGEIMLARKTANLLARTGQTDKARALLEKALELNPKSARAHIVFSEFLFTYFSDSAEDREISLKLANDAVDRFPDEPEVYENLVRRYLIEGKRKEARDVIDMATKRGNPDPYFWLRLGQLAKRTWPTRTSATQVPVLVNGIFEKALKQAGSDTNVVEAVGDYYRKSNQHQRAEEIYLEIISDHPERLDVRRKLVAVLAAQSKQEEMIGALKGIVEIDPQDADTNRELGRIFAGRMDARRRAAQLFRPPADDPDLIEAAKYFQQSLQASKGAANEYLLAGELFQWAEKPDDSISILEEGAYLYPESPRFPQAIADTYMSADRWEEAIKPLERTVKLATQSEPELLNDLFYFRFGVAHERSGNIDEAAVKLRKSIEIIAGQDPAKLGRTQEGQDQFTANVYNYLGYTWVENDMNIDEGGELIKTALKLDPTSGAITDSLGWYYFKKEKFEDALKTLLKAEEMMDKDREEEIAKGGSPETDGVIYDHIAQSFWMTGSKKEAVEYMEKAVKFEEERKEEFEKRLKEYRDNEPPVAKKPTAPEEAPPAPKPAPDSEKLESPAPEKAADKNSGE